MQSTSSFHEFTSRVKKSYFDDGKYSDWMESVKVTLGILIERPRDLSIYKVPNKLRRLKEDAYSPHIVSIGPFHERKHELAAMEEHKWRYMLNFIRRAASTADEDSDDYSSANENAVTSPAEEGNQGKQHPTERALEKCGKAISKLEEVARACYADSINLEKNKLVEILLVDGCFMLELFIKHADKEEEEDTNHPHQEVDTIINNSWMVPALQHDLALLENQIPFVVLHKLFDTMETLANKKFRFSLNKYVLLFFRSALSFSDTAIDNISNSLITTPKHLLDILHKAYKPKLTIPTKNLKGPLELHEWGLKRCATELFMSGIQFQVADHEAEDTRSLLDITFREGVVTIPQVVINKSSDYIFRNLIALEQCRIGGHHVTSYVSLMSSLIRSPKDAKLLGGVGVVFNRESGEDVSTFFNNLRKEVVCKDFYYEGLCEEVNEYHRFPLHWRRVKAYFKVLPDEWTESFRVLRQTYFRNRWSFISFLTALFVIIITLLQTIYAILSYY